MGSNWNVQQVFSGGDGVIYRIDPDGDLIWRRHDVRADGSSRLTLPVDDKVGWGWNFKEVFSGGIGIIYAITEQTVNPDTKGVQGANSSGSGTTAGGMAATGGPRRVHMWFAATGHRSTPFPAATA